jgi:hypothetical protein
MSFANDKFFRLELERHMELLKQVEKVCGEIIYSIEKLEDRIDNLESMFKENTPKNDEPRKGGFISKVRDILQ